jgi:hypothetical protein
MCDPIHNILSEIFGYNSDAVKVISLLECYAVSIV